MQPLRVKLCGRSFSTGHWSNKREKIIICLRNLPVVLSCVVLLLFLVKLDELLADLGKIPRPELEPHSLREFILLPVELIVLFMLFGLLFGPQIRLFEPTRSGFIGIEFELIAKAIPSGEIAIGEYKSPELLVPTTTLLDGDVARANYSN